MARSILQLIKKHSPELHQSAAAKFRPFRPHRSAIMGNVCILDFNFASTWRNLFCMYSLGSNPTRAGTKQYYFIPNFQEEEIIILQLYLKIYHANSIHPYTNWRIRVERTICTVLSFPCPGDVMADIFANYATEYLCMFGAHRNFQQKTVSHEDGYCNGNFQLNSMVLRLLKLLMVKICASKKSI